ncbi:MAG: hypothetical protein ABR600_00765 [Actinomycetota bacterium]
MRGRPAAAAPALALALVVLAACTGGGGPPHESPTASPPGPAIVGSAAEAMARLCRRPPVNLPSAQPAKHVPDVIVETEHQVEAVRQLQYRHPVAVEAVTRKGLIAGIDQEFAHSFPVGQTDRRNIAWQTIGVIPKQTDLEGVVHQYLSSQVIGYYDPATKGLRYIGTENPTPIQRFVLAHELTHALDDQHFGLRRLNDIENGCQDEELEAATGAVEGSAVYFSSQVLTRFFTSRDQNAVSTNRPVLLTGVPQFLINLLQWPYGDGTSFINALVRRGGVEAVNRALRDLPVSTEQVIHPGKYPGDVPVPLDIPDLGPKLGDGWHDLDVEAIGEQWLSDMLGLQLDPLQAEPAAAGWDGGLYRAWRHGARSVVVMKTAWDTQSDAQEFARAMSDWLSGRPTAVVRQDQAGETVTVLFASDATTYRTLTKAALEAG